MQKTGEQYSEDDKTDPEHQRRFFSNCIDQRDIGNHY